MFLTNFVFFRISPRTLVTQDDPLGALNDETDETVQVPAAQEPENLEHLEAKKHLYTDQPVLFKGHRSATFDESVHMNKSMHRSETMPVNSVTSSLANLGSSLKFFG